jgi:hypothetical protein
LYVHRPFTAAAVCIFAVAPQFYFSFARLFTFTSLRGCGNGSGMYGLFCFMYYMCHDPSILHRRRNFDNIKTIIKNEKAKKNEKSYGLWLATIVN